METCAEAGSERNGAPPEGRSAGEAERRPAPSACDVLVIDDDESTREVLEYALSIHGYSVLMAASGREALDILAALDVVPRVLVLDLIMPGMSGEELVREVRRTPRLAGVPVLVFSGAPNLDDRCKKLGCAGCVRKPGDIDALLDWLDRHTG